jgi:hypothetical protein
MTLIKTNPILVMTLAIGVRVGGVNSLETEGRRIFINWGEIVEK